MSITSRALPGPAPACHARRSAWPSTRSSWRTCPNVNERRNVPSVDGAIARCPRTASVRPALSTSQSSMQSAPSSIAWISESTLRPGRDAPGRLPRSTAASTSASIPSRRPSVTASMIPALTTTRSSSKTTVRSVRQIVHHASDLLTQAAVAPNDSFLPAQEVISLPSPGRTGPTERWIQARPCERRRAGGDRNGANRPAAGPPRVGARRVRAMSGASVTARMSSPAGNSAQQSSSASSGSVGVPAGRCAAAERGRPPRTPGRRAAPRMS